MCNAKPAFDANTSARIPALGRKRQPWDNDLHS